MSLGKRRWKLPLAQKNGAYTFWQFGQNLQKQNGSEYVESYNPTNSVYEQC